MTNEVDESDSPEPFPESPASSYRQLALPVGALAVALLALVLTGWMWFNPRVPTPQYTDAQRADAKTKVCTAFSTVRKGVSVNTNMKAPEGPTHDVGALAIAANARASLSNGGQYLLARLDPATPTELADAVRAFANILLDVGAAATAGLPNTDPAQAARLHDADTKNNAIASLCKP